LGAANEIELRKQQVRPGRPDLRWTRVLCLVVVLDIWGWLLLAMFGVPTTASATTPYDWPQFNFDSRHSGNNTLERTISSGTVSKLHRLYRVTLPSIADGAPAFLSAVSTISGTRDLLFVTTKAGHIIALDADTGLQVWSRQHGPNGCISSNGGTCYTTSSPAIDPNRQYVYSYGLDGNVHKHAVGDGTETLSAGWPETATLKGNSEKSSSALSIATSVSGTFLYVANGGYPGDAGDYQGHVTAIKLADGSQKVFNTVCSNQSVHFVQSPGTPDCPSVQSAIWARAGVVYDPDTGKIYMATGNGDYVPSSHYWGDTAFALYPDGSGAAGNPLDTYTPVNYAALQSGDTDLGSTAPAILTPTTGSNLPHLAVQGGKDAKLRLINLDDLSGHGATGFTGGEIVSITVPMGGVILTMPAVWMNPADNSTWFFIANGGGIAGLKLAVGGGTPGLNSSWSQNTNGGTSPIIANGILFYAGSNLIRALNPTTGAELWRDTSIGGIHWESPIVANGILYITDESSQLTAYETNIVYLPIIMK
jgi:putative pyrroloquinoline-quinone binding quinoprotein